ncbi:Uncharacterised protein [Candidatus Bilamarchaeum dharawalense]|uniref:Uncharacterized protein n=1 Tax=Candidatus Bilamarchaeum dharawalense TaxID=2885759 RepID=A0A5E4LTW2_9ARCH|nr:Uncharacterised protein [Candidatus Bilamarchaeum dharawalense]
MATEFEISIEEAKKLEGKIVEYAPYKGEIEIEKTMELEPVEYIDLTYDDLLNIYERDQKIISTASMGILTSREEVEIKATPKVVETEEVETRLREMTTETLQKAEEVGKEPMVVEVPVETKPVQNKIEFEVRTVSEPEIPKPTIERSQEEPQQERKVIVANVPPALRESPTEAASEKYGRMEEQIRATIGERADELTLKKKMLDLTKQLFKEKTTDKREELKLQITILKNMLTGAQSGATKSKKKQEDATHTKLFEAMINGHQAELAQTKESIMDSYKKQIAEIKKKFYADLEGVEDQTRKREILESFVFSITSLAEQIPEVLDKYTDFTVKKHTAELEKIRESLDSDERSTMTTVNDRIEYIKNNYSQEFVVVKGIIGKEIENLIDVAGVEVFRKPEEKQKESESKVHDLVREINETDEGTLLYYLHSNDVEYYRKYEHKEISKSEAIFKAKELMAHEKGLSDSTVRKYFSQKEG